MWLEVLRMGADIYICSFGVSQSSIKFKIFYLFGWFSTKSCEDLYSRGENLSSCVLLKNGIPNEHSSKFCVAWSIDVLYMLQCLVMRSYISGYQKLRSGRYINFLNPKMTSNENSLNYKVVDLSKATSFVQSLSPSEFIKKLRFFKNSLTLTAMGHGGCRCYSDLPWVTAVCPYHHGPRRQ
jgi:hypothetical protein